MTVPFLLFVYHSPPRQVAPMWHPPAATDPSLSLGASPQTYQSCWGLGEKWVLSFKPLQINVVERPQIWLQWGAEASDLRDICISWLDCTSVNWEPGRLWRRVVISGRKSRWKMTFHSSTCLHWRPHSTAWGWVPTLMRPPRTDHRDRSWVSREGGGCQGPSWPRLKFCRWIWAFLCAEAGEDPPSTMAGADVNPPTAAAAVAIKSSENRLVLCTEVIPACSSALASVSHACGDLTSFPSTRGTQGHHPRAQSQAESLYIFPLTPCNIQLENKLSPLLFSFYWVNLG